MRFPILILPLLIILAPAALAQTTFTVNTTADPGDGTCNASECTLREAITAANMNVTVTDAIMFAIPGTGPHTIQPASALPGITDPVVIDGETQDGADCGSDIPSRTLKVVLDGSSAGSGSGITLDTGSDGSTIRGLVINNWSSDGIRIAGSDDNTIACNFIGTDHCTRQNSCGGTFKCGGLN